MEKYYKSNKKGTPRSSSDWWQSRQKKPAFFNKIIWITEKKGKNKLRK